MLNQLSIKKKIILSSLLLTLAFFSINYLQKNDLGIQINLLRNLLSKEEVDKVCEKSHKSFKENYSKEYVQKRKMKSPNEYESEIMEYIEKKDFSKLEKYSKYLLLRFGLIIILDVVFIIFWIIYCSCCCCPKCCCRNRNKIGCCEKCSYGISILFSSLVLAGGVAGLVIGRTIKMDLNSTECSVYKIFSHFENGLENDYPDLPRWIGFNEIEVFLSNAENDLAELSKTQNDIHVFCNDPDNKQICSEYKEAQDYLDGFSNFGEIDTVKQKINEFNSPIKDIEKDYIDKSYDFLNNRVEKNIQIVYIILFGFMIIIGLLSLISIAIYAGMCKCFKCIYFIVWNVEMVFLLIIILIGVVFGVIGLFGKNAISIVDYTLSEENLKTNKPFLITPEIKKYINVCLYEDGNLKKELPLNQNSIESLNKFYLSIKNIAKKDKENGLIKLFLKEIEIIEKIFGNYIQNDIFEFTNCKFLKSDINILLDNLDKYMFKTLSLFSIALVAAGYCAIISIAFGILVINRYTETKKEPVDIDMMSAEVRIVPENGNISNEKITKSEK